MVGYGGQLVALNVNTPSETQLATAQADTAQTQAKVLRATAPAVIQQQQQQAKAGELALADQLKLRALQDKMWEGMQAGQQTSATPLAPAAQSVQSPTTPLFDPRIEDVMDSINPDDPNAAAKWDASMAGLAKDVPQAKQFVGQFSKGSLNNWRAQMGAHAVSSPLANASSLGQFATRSPLAPAAAPQQGAPAAAPMGAISPLTGKYDPVLAEMSVRFPEKAKEYQAMEGMMLYQQTGNPEVLKRWAPDVYAKLATATNSMSDAQKTRLAAQADFMGNKANAVIVLGNRVKEAGGDPNTDPKVRAAYNTSVQQAAKEGFISPQEAQDRLAKPIDWAELAGRAVEAQTVTAYLQQDVQHQAALKGAEAGAEASAKAPFEQHFTQVGSDANGNLNVMDTKTGQVKDTGVQVQNKQQQYFDAKREAWLNTHPGDEAGAVAFAGGKKDLSPTQLAAMAQANTIKQQANATMMGQDFNYDDAYAANLQMLQTAQAAPTGPQPAAPTGGVPSAHGHPPTQRQAAVDFTKTGTIKIWQPDGKPPLEKKVPYNPKAAVGTAGNPAFPANQAAYDKLHAGTLFVGLDGLLHVKK